MAKFSSAFGLCAIGDQRGMLGISADEKGCAVVTIGKNMVIRYRLSDQKQLNSWSTMLAKLSSMAVFNPTSEKYIGVFDSLYVKQWDRSEANLEKVKKQKLSSEVHEILLHRKDETSASKVLIVFKNGACTDLDNALENRKEPLPGFLLNEEIIQMVDIVTLEEKGLFIVVSKIENKYQLCCLEFKNDNYQLNMESLKKVKLRRQGASLLGYCTFFGDGGISLLTFWSDGFLYSLSLPPAQSEQGLGKFIGTISTVSRKSEVAMKRVSESHVAIYAGDISEEGAVLGIYNVNFGMMQTQTHFKMFNKPPRMWIIENSLLVLMGQRLVCVPFNLQSQSLSALVGSRPLVANLATPSDICSVMPTAIWENNVENVNIADEEDYPKSIKEQFSVLSSEGWAESGICRILLTELIEKKDMDTIYWILQNFIDIPEELLVKLIILSFEDAEKKDRFLKKILAIPVDRTNLLKNLRTHLKLEEGLQLLRYLCGLTEKIQDNDDNIYDWTMTVVDAFYQQFILSRDTAVLGTISSFKSKIGEQLLLVDEMKKLLPLIVRLQNGKGIVRKQNYSKNYLVEKIRLYE